MILVLSVLAKTGNCLPQSSPPSGVEILGVKNLGLSAANESLSVLQVKWKVTEPNAPVKRFEVKLAVTYAYGALQTATASVDDPVRAVRFEFPTLHFSGGKPGAELRNYRVNITTDRAESVNKQGVL